MKIAVVALTSLWLLVPLSLRGQESAGAPFTLRGEVRDYLTEMPIPGAVVQIAELAVSQVTDANGYFEFSDVPAGEHTFVTASFGYETNQEPSEIGPGNIMLVRLNPMPVSIPGVRVEVESLLQHLETRRIMTGFGSTVFEAEQMAHGLSASLTTFLTERTAGPEIVRSPNDQLCVVTTPGSSPVRLRVFVDESAVPTAFLDNLQPQDVALLEYFPRLAMVRAYSQSFLDRAAEAGYGPTPIDIVNPPRGC